MLACHNLGPSGHSPAWSADDLTWQAALLRINPLGWAPFPPKNCSFFDDDASRCSRFRWQRFSPDEYCCACGGGLDGGYPSAPPAPPPSFPSPPLPPCYAAGSRAHAGITGPSSWHLLEKSDDGSQQWAVGFKRCEWFGSADSPSDACEKYTWIDLHPTNFCCECGGGTFSQPLPPPLPPMPPVPPPASPPPPPSPSLPPKPPGFVHSPPPPSPPCPTVPYPPRPPPHCPPLPPGRPPLQTPPPLEPPLPMSPQPSPPFPSPPPLQPGDESTLEASLAAALAQDLQQAQEGGGAWGRAASLSTLDMTITLVGLGLALTLKLALILVLATSPTLRRQLSRGLCCGRCRCSIGATGEMVEQGQPVQKSWQAQKPWDGAGQAWDRRLQPAPHSELIGTPILTGSRDWSFKGYAQGSPLRRGSLIGSRQSHSVPTCSPDRGGRAARRSQMSSCGKDGNDDFIPWTTAHASEVGLGRAATSRFSEHNGQFRPHVHPSEDLAVDLAEGLGSDLASSGIEYTDPYPSRPGQQGGPTPHSGGGGGEDGVEWYGRASARTPPPPPPPGAAAAASAPQAAPPWWCMLLGSDSSLGGTPSYQLNHERWHPSTRDGTETTLSESQMTNTPSASTGGVRWSTPAAGSAQQQSPCAPLPGESGYESAGAQANNPGMTTLEVREAHEERQQSARGSALAWLLQQAGSRCGTPSDSLGTVHSGALGSVPPSARCEGSVRCAFPNGDVMQVSAGINSGASDDDEVTRV